MRTTRSVIIAAAGAFVLLGALPACGGGGAGNGSEVASLGTDGATDDATDGTTVAGPEDPEEAMLAYTECMRDHGVDMPDPQSDGEGRTMVALDADPESGEFQEAQEACEPLMDNAVSRMEVDPEREAEMKEQLLAYSACMRDHGIDMPDPTFGENGRVEIQAGGGDEGAAPVDDSDFEAANAECADGDMVMAAPTQRSGDSDDGGQGGGGVLEMQTGS